MDGRTLHFVLQKVRDFLSDEAALHGFEDDAKELVNSLDRIAISVYDAKEDDETKKRREEAVKKLSAEIREVCYDLEDAVDAYASRVLRSRNRKAPARIGWFPAASYSFSWSGMQSPFRTDIQVVQTELKKILVDLNKEPVNQKVEEDADGAQIRQDNSAYSFDDKRMVIGRKGDLDAVLNMLLKENNTQEPKGLVRVMPIVGRAGIGKTTLAQLIYHDIKVTSHFNMRFWVPFSDDFDVIKILKAIVRSSIGTTDDLADRVNGLVKLLKPHIEGKQLLIVMDDVWNSDRKSWNDLRAPLASLKAKSITILVTTRNEEIARMQDTFRTYYEKEDSIISGHCLKELSTEECWQLLSTIAFSRASSYKSKELEDIGRQIVIKCNGLPLAAKHLGDHLQSRSSSGEWLKVLNSEISDLDDFDEGFFPYFGLGNPNKLSPAPVSIRDNTETLPFIDHVVYGRQKELNKLLSMLQDYKHEEGHLHIIPIVGMAGIGKTTLVQAIYNNKDVASRFQERVWVCVSDDFDVKRILKEITEDLTGTAATSDLVDILIRSLQNHMKEKRLLLVLDDVQSEGSEQGWHELKGHLSAVAQGTTVLATARTWKVADDDHVFPLEKLLPNDCMDLFSDIAFSGRNEEERENLKEIGRDIVAKCNGLPLAIKTLAGYMRFKKTREEWENVLRSEISSLGGTEADLNQIITRSFNHLHPVLKLCLSYCAVFPKGHSIEIDMLIKLWMAQGYLGSNENTDMEKVGLEHFKDLQMHSFFQDFRKDPETCSMTCKINGVVHVFLQSLSKRECFTKKVDPFKGAEFELPEEKARHSSLVVAPRTPFPDSIRKVEKLRSLLVWSQYAFVTSTCLHDLFQQLRCLRALCFSCCSIAKIPKEIGKMDLLRYLNLSYNRNLKKLPKEVCDLYNLQTLNLNGCDNLEKLPQGMGKLTNLRHLEILWTKSLRFLPKGVGKLGSLLTLNRFVISRSSGHKACNLGDLKNFEKLKGYLGIEGLGNVTNVDEASKGILESKKGIAGLDLWFSGVGTREIKCGPVHEVSTTVGSDVQSKETSPYDLLDALEPHSELQYLGIYYFGSTEFPNWMTSLPKLRELILFECRKCKILPCLAELPYLESLEIWEMENVTKIGLDVAESVNHQFPKLERLRIHNMRQWEDWEIIPRKKDDVAAMPSLLSLTVEGCPKLKSLPHYLQNSRKLCELSISGCPNLTRSCQKGTGEDWGKISHIRNIKIDGEVVQGDIHHGSDFPSSSGKALNRQFTKVRSPSRL